MILVTLVVLPAIGAAAAFLDRSPSRRGAWLPGVAGLHLALTAAAWAWRPAPALGGWLAFDPLGGLVLSLTSVVFAAVATTAARDLTRDERSGRPTFVAGLLAFLAAGSLVTLTHHFGLLWVGMEATTLATAPLIVDPGNRRSLEAVWKYLMVCSVGIALALLGTFFLATAQEAGVLDDLIRNAPHLHTAWLRGAFVFLLVGYGTKMGLVPMHSWLPDAHGEAPSPVSALLSGALLNLAFLALLRGQQVVVAAGEGAFAQPMLIGIGLLSLLVAAAFLLRQQNVKRMLAYSSVEHMGMLAIGVGVGGLGAWGALFHMLGASLSKAMLFLTAGQILTRFNTKRTREVRGALRALPASGGLFIAGLFALTGSPPFSSFVSELALLQGTLQSSRGWLVAAMVLLQAVIFVAMGSAVLDMMLGDPPAERTGPEDRRTVLAPALLLATVLVLGVWLPPALRQVLAQASASLGGTAP